MYTAELVFPADFDGWRDAARAAFSNSIPPEQIAFTVSGEGVNLFSEPLTHRDPDGPQPTVPRRFVDLARKLVCHADEDRFVFAYRLLWRLQTEKRLLDIASDADVIRAGEMEKAVRRDSHKMKAFVRFREIESEAGDKHYVAWFEPFHHIVEATAPFFVRRFTGMNWTILTPRRTASWDGADLSFLPGASRDMAPSGDDMEDLWLTYYASIFNPARLKVKAMQAEMPKKYWANMPETALVKPLVAGAEAAQRRMIETAPSLPSLRHEKMTERREAVMGLDSADEPMLGLDGDEANTGSNLPKTIEDARRAAASCQACPLWEPATQTVFGKGPEDAPVIFVGEQPGDQEDIAGEPFVGPAGKVFDEALLSAGVDRKQAYVTNAVKHFKFTPRGKRRIHAKPNMGEIKTCRWWLDLERELVKPKLIVALGATAAQAVLGKTVTIRDSRSKLINLTDEIRFLVTVHPSYILRLPDAAAQERERQAFRADMGLVLKTVPELALTN
ncbi:Uracil-DNA glycosylase:Phage SPO1 DNA polymerase-related protein [Fulvimarina pelagi HTCC2506]|uniref:Type-4 uracil-DNA glycosylase n=1 Tax=Fulvimarina pelagi HTCC2506 TaxID=314231 RepID=Q0G5C5_9HYPH|nr:UdgX family uracil-DNA binding protein [Fulvimarina pelagi]EAU43139.1 Uracil-DNA glycosylase:Phage SPO1 DNA polymerase-related protein [Fulvimarina pelagi HTCC2506]